MLKKLRSRAHYLDKVRRPSPMRSITSRFCCSHIQNTQGMNLCGFRVGWTFFMSVSVVARAHTLRSGALTW